MTVSPSGKRIGRPPHNPARATVEIAETGDDHADRLRDIIGRGISVIDAEMNTLVDGAITPENIDRILVLTAKASEIRGQIVRADANLSRNKLTLAQIEKGIAKLSPDEQAHLAEKMGANGQKASSLA